MREDEDFTRYVGARWPGLVRSVVLLGCPEDAAADVATDALARLQRGWPRTRQTGDVDAVVHTELVRAWDRFRRRDPWVGRTAAAGDALPLDPELADELDQLTPLDRADRVFTGDDRLRRATETIAVLAPPSGPELTEVRRQARTRRTRRAVAIALPVVLVLALLGGGGTWLATRGDRGDGLGAVAVVRQENPAGIVWEAGGVLHLAHVTMDLPVLRQVAAFGAGAVYLDTLGRIVYVDDDGTRTLLGTGDPGTPFVASDQQGWVAWVDRTESPPTLVVYEVRSRSVVGRRTLTRDTRPVAIDDYTVYFQDSNGAAQGWQPTADPPTITNVEPGDLLDVRSRTRLFQFSARTIRLEPGAFAFSLAVPGTGGRLSPDGRYVVTRLGGPKDSYGEVAVYDTRSGRRLDSGIASDEVALEAAPGPDATVTYIVARASDRPESETYIRSSSAGRLQLRTCTLQPPGVPAECVANTSNIPAAGIPPLLAD